MARGGTVGLDIATGEPCDPATAGIYDNYLVKRQARCAHIIHVTAALLRTQCLRAGASVRETQGMEGWHCRGGNLATQPFYTCTW